MFHIRGSKHLPEKYAYLFLRSIDRLYQAEDPRGVIELISKELSLPFLGFFSYSEDNINLNYCNILDLQGLKGKNDFIKEHIEDGHNIKENSLNKVLFPLLEQKEIERIEYKRNIKQIFGLVEGSTSLIAGLADLIDEDKIDFLSIILPHLSNFETAVLLQREKNEYLEKENRMLESLVSFINFSDSKVSFSEIADFAVNQIYLEMDYPAVYIVLKDTVEWRLVALNSSLMTQQALKIFGKKFEDLAFPIDQIGDNKLIEYITTKLEPFTSKFLRDAITPPLMPDEVDKVQALLQVKTVYAVPIHMNGNIFGTIVYLSKKDDIKVYEEQVLKSYAYQLAISLALARQTQTMKSAKDTIDAAYQNLEDINKAKDNLISIASHELRTPATVARNAISLLFEYKKDMDPFVIDKLGMIKEAADRELNIINTMLEASRINMRKMELFYQQIDIEHIIEVASSEMGLEAAKKGIALDYIKKDSPLPKITADATRIREVLDNLITNAIKYTNEGSITITSSLKDSFIEVSVADTGKGISEEMQQSLFQMFHRVTDTKLPYNKQESHQGGLGLGLYIIKNIIEAHGGSIDVISKVGEGSTFTFLIPIKNG